MDADDEYGYGDELTEEELRCLDEIVLAAYGGAFWSSIGTWCFKLNIPL